MLCKRSPSPRKSEEPLLLPGVYFLVIRFIVVVLHLSPAVLSLAINVIYSFVSLMALGETETQQRQNDKCLTKGFSGLGLRPAQEF